MSVISAALLCALAEFVCFGGDWLLGQNMADQPIVVGPLVGLLLGDLQTGLILGASLEALFIGAVNVGGAISLNPSFGTVLSVAFVILGGGDSKTAIALAVPLGLLGGMLEIGMNIVCAFFGNAWDKAAAEGNERRIVGLHYGVWFFKYFVISAVVFISVLIGVEPVSMFIKSLPKFIENGLAVTGGLLPAVGFAMLLSMIWSKKLAVFYLLGFVLVSYMKLPLIAVGSVGLVFAVVFALYDKEILDAKKHSSGGSSGSGTQESEEEDFLS